MQNKLPVLYILMRTDLASMNAGKAIAQGSHASNAFLDHYDSQLQSLSSKSPKEMPENIDELIRSVNQWKSSTKQGFGTVLVLDAYLSQIDNAVKTALVYDYIAGIVHDPSYPIQDGKVVHHIPLDTCAYIFVPDKYTDVHMAEILSGMTLYP